MARGITENDVWQAADALLVEGARPTIERVRLKIGRGSPNTVSPFLDTWFAQLGQRIQDARTLANASGIPDAVVSASRQVWAVALAETQKDIEQKITVGLADAVAAVEAGKERIALAEASAYEANARGHRVEGSLQERTSQLEAERIAHAATAADYRSAQQQLAALQKRLVEVENATRGMIEKHAAAVEASQARADGADRRAALALESERQTRIKAEKRVEQLEQRRDAIQLEMVELRAELSQQTTGRQVDAAHARSALDHQVRETQALRLQLHEVSKQLSEAKQGAMGSAVQLKVTETLLQRLTSESEGLRTGKQKARRKATTRP